MEATCFNVDFMEFRFLGGAREVGRSAILMKDDRNLLFDFGVKIDHKIEYPISTPRVDAMILSHAHLDHSGSTPAIYDESNAKTFGTSPTLRLSNLLLDDSISIAKKEHKMIGFNKAHIKDLINKYVALDYHHVAGFGNFDISMYDAGHITGSSITLVERARAKNHKRVVYTGDFKLQKQALHRGAEVVKSDVLIIESTYAVREHPDRAATTKNFIENINTVLDNGGNVLLPVFAVGRSQEMLAVLYENGVAGSTYIDGMAKDATSIVMNFPKFVSNYDTLAKAARDVNWIGKRSERKEALNGPSVILTTSGMLTGGPVLDYITKINKNSEILLTGFQQEGTNGKMLVEKGCIIIDGNKKKINAPVRSYDFSAHAGMSDLHDYVRGSSPEVVLCVHGDENNAVALAEALKLEGFDARAPRLGETVKLDD
jgi:putative mRNA 3-end processing factor